MTPAVLWLARLLFLLQPHLNIVSIPVNVIGVCSKNEGVIVCCKQHGLQRVEVGDGSPELNVLKDRTTRNSVQFGRNIL